MGLDSYLNARLYVGGRFEHRNVTGGVNISVEGTEVDVPVTSIEEITLHVAYWRKCNQIHNWFVEKVQDGEDNCGEYPVSYEQICELEELCKKSLKVKDKAPEVLPTKSGFFFGSTDYDEDYFDDLQYTLEQLKEAHELQNRYGTGKLYLSFYYTSSW